MQPSQRFLCTLFHHLFDPACPRDHFEYTSQHSVYLRMSQGDERFGHQGPSPGQNQMSTEAAPVQQSKADNPPWRIEMYPSFTSEECDNSLVKELNGLRRPRGCSKDNWEVVRSQARKQLSETFESSIAEASHEKWDVSKVNLHVEHSISNKTTTFQLHLSGQSRSGRSFQPYQTIAGNIEERTISSPSEDASVQVGDL
jgi:hypothetical protein